MVVAGVVGGGEEGGGMRKEKEGGGGGGREGLGGGRISPPARHFSASIVRRNWINAGQAGPLDGRFPAAARRARGRPGREICRCQATLLSFLIVRSSPFVAHSRCLISMSS